MGGREEERRRECVSVGGREEERRRECVSVGGREEERRRECVSVGGREEERRRECGSVGGRRKEGGTRGRKEWEGSGGWYSKRMPKQEEGDKEAWRKAVGK